MDRRFRATSCGFGPESRKPLIILLHGRSGLSFYGESFGIVARELARAGFVAMIPHYFAATDSPDSPDVTEARFRKWQSALAAAMTFGTRLEFVGPGRIGVAGFSLGGFLALTQAASDGRIGAVASSSAGVSRFSPARVVHMPPVLILHATNDPVVPIAEERRLVERLRAAGVEPEVVLYPRREHILTGEVWRDSLEKMVAFSDGS